MVTSFGNEPFLARNTHSYTGSPPEFQLTLALTPSAVASLDEGLDEPLTLHRVGVFRELGTSLNTSNALESIHARVESRIAKVDHWKNSEQKQRWLATALLDLEPRLRRIKHFRALPLLRAALTRRIEGMKKSAA